MDEINLLDGKDKVPTRLPSSYELEELITRLLLKRSMAKDTLQKLAIECVLENRHRFLQQNNPFANLSRDIVKMVTSAVLADGMLKSEKMCLQLELLNSHTNEFDYEESWFPESDTIFFKHLLQNCPQILKVKITKSVWLNDFFLPRRYQEYIFPIMASSWKNLNFLIVDLGQDTASNMQNHKKRGFLKSSRSSVEVICRSMPKLCGLDLSLPIEKLGMDDVEHLSKMEHLKILRLHFPCVNSEKEILVVVQAAGRVPHLERFSFTTTKTRGDCYFWFLKQYADLYPEKPLILEKHWLDLSQNSSWPSNLAVEELHVLGQIRNFDTSSLPKNCLQTLHLDRVSVSNIHTLVKSLGSSIIHLYISTRHAFQNELALNLRTLLVACPKLQKIQVNDQIRLKLDQSSTVENLPAHFRNLSSFSILSLYFYGAYDKVVIMAYKEFFCNCRKMLRVHTIESDNELCAIAWLLKKNLNLPTCFDELEELQFRNLNSTYGVVVSVIKMLMERSPFLKKVTSLGPCFELRRPRWLSKVMDAVGIAFHNNTEKEEVYYSTEEVYDWETNNFC